MARFSLNPRQPRRAPVTPRPRIGQHEWCTLTCWDYAAKFPKWQWQAKLQACMDRCQSLAWAPPAPPSPSRPQRRPGRLTGGDSIPATAQRCYRKDKGPTGEDGYDHSCCWRRIGPVMLPVCQDFSGNAYVDPEPPEPFRPGGATVRSMVRSQFR